MRKSEEFSAIKLLLFIGETEKYSIMCKKMSFIITLMAAFSHKHNAFTAYELKLWKL